MHDFRYFIIILAVIFINHMKAMLLAAGFGTRLQPFTLHHPKALAMVNGQSLLERNVKYLQTQGIFEVLVNVHHFAEQIVAAIELHKGWGSHITISDETDAVLETGGGILKAAWYFDSSPEFVVMNADMLTDMPLKAIVQEHRLQLPLATLATTNRNSNRKLVFNEQNTLVGWRNEQTGQEKGPMLLHADKNQFHAVAFSGIQVLSNQIFSLITQSGKFSMIDVYLSLCADHTITAFDHSNSLLIDVGKPESLEKAATMFA